MQPPISRRVTSYGLDRSVTSWVLRPESAADVLACLDFAAGKGLSICPAGGRNSFGDVFLLGDHVSLDMTGLGRILSFDPEAGTLTVEAGALERDVLALVLPHGWQLPAASGSLWNTIGGNLSSNINGKDAWKVGTFGDQVVSFRIVLADGTTRHVDRERDGALFAAVVGGLGLLGVVTEVTLRLRRVPSVMLERRSWPTATVPELLDHFACLDPATVDLSYAWVDAFAGARAVCESARFVAAAAPVSVDELRRGLVPRSTVFGLPPAVFWGAVSRTWRLLFAVGATGAVFRALNGIKYARARMAGERVGIVSFPEYQYPMAKLLPYWNLKFAPHGFNEVQALFPTDRFADGLRALLAVCARRGRTPELCAVRRHRADTYDLSFAGDGLSVTVPFSLAGFADGRLAAFRSELMETVVGLGGKVYLSKFPYLDPAAFRQMYPAHRRFLDVKRRVDPDRRFWSDTAERLLA